LISEAEAPDSGAKKLDTFRRGLTATAVEPYRKVSNEKGAQTAQQLAHLYFAVFDYSGIPLAVCQRAVAGPYLPQAGQ